MTAPGAPTSTLRLLIADRRGWIARALINVLDPTEWSVSHSHGGGELLEMLRRVEPHAIVLNDDLQDMDVDTLIRRLRAEPAIGVVTPIAVVSTGMMRERRLELLRAGATEHFLFPVDPEPFLLRLRALAGARREVERLRRAALVEVETGLYNPAGLERRGQEIATDATRRREPLSCVVFAPPAPRRAASGERERTAASLGTLARKAARLSDAVGRLDDVLVVIAPATGQPGAQRLAERLQQTLDEAAEPAGRGENRDGPRVRAAYCAVADFARSTLGVPEMIQRAVSALGVTDGTANAPTIVGESVPLAPP